MGKVAERVTGTTSARNTISEDDPDKVKRRTMSARNHMLKLASTADQFNLDEEDRAAIYDRIAPAIQTLQNALAPKDKKPAAAAAKS